jgi:hypothetical protein
VKVADKTAPTNGPRLNTKNGFSGVADVIPPDCHDHGIRAIQPYMKDDWSTSWK